MCEFLSIILLRTKRKSEIILSYNELFQCSHQQNLSKRCTTYPMNTGSKSRRNFSAAALSESALIFQFTLIIFFKSFSVNSYIFPAVAFYSHHNFNVVLFCSACAGKNCFELIPLDNIYIVGSDLIFYSRISKIILDISTKYFCAPAI